MFRTKFDIISDRSNRMYAHPSDGFLKTYKLVISDNGAEVLKPDVAIDIYARIQADADSVDINNIVSRYINGDSEALNRIKGAFFDARNIPKNYAELKNMIMQSEDAFYHLPVEIKEQFNNNPTEFWSKYGSDYFKKVFSDYVNPTFDDIADNINFVNDSSPEGLEKGDK